MAARPRARVLIADAAAAERRRLARVLTEGGYEVLTAPDRQAACSMLRARRVEVVVCTLALVEGSHGLDELTAADRDVRVVLAVASHQAELGAALAFGRPCVCIELPLAHERWLHLLIDRAAWERRAAVALRQSRLRDVDRVLGALGQQPYRAAKTALLRRFDAAYLAALTGRSDPKTAARRSGLSAASFRALRLRVAEAAETRPLAAVEGSVLDG